jgi:hypothetical protein
LGSRIPCIRSHIQPRPVVFDALITFRATALPAKTLARLRRPRLLSIGLPVSGSRTDFEFVQLIPLFIGSIPFRDGKKFANPATRINWLWFIHTRIMNYTAADIQYSRKKSSAAKSAMPSFERRIRPYNPPLF